MFTSVDNSTRIMDMKATGPNGKIRYTHYPSSQTPVVSKRLFATKYEFTFDGIVYAWKGGIVRIDCRVVVPVRT